LEESVRSGKILQEHNAAEEWDRASYEAISMDSGIKSGVKLVLFLLRRS